MSTDSLNRAAGVGTYADINGTKYKMSPLLPADFAEARAYLRSITPSPVEEAKKLVEGLPDHLAEVLIREAWKDHQQWGKLTSPQGREWIGSTEGIAFFCWLSIRREQPEVKLDFILKEFHELEEAALKEVMSSLDRLGPEDENPTTVEVQPVKLSLQAPRRRKRKRRKKKK